MMDMWCLLFLVSVASCNSIWPVENRILQLRTSAPRSDSPPSYMVHLYNRYRKGRMPYSTANTVRSFFSTPGRLGNEDILVFNLTGVHPTEYVERVDFHIQSKGSYHQSSRLDQKKAQMELDILDLSRPLRPKIETIQLTRVQSGEWQTLDITDSIIQCLEGEAEQHHLVGMAIRGVENVDISDIVSQPFLVLFSEDDDHLDIEELGRDVNILRQKREVLDNELPDYTPVNMDGAEVQARLKYKDSTIVSRAEARKVSKTEMEKHRKRRRRRRRKDKRLPYAWGKGWLKKSDLKNNPDYEGDEEEDSEEEDGANDELLCQKRKLVVSFAEIGWGDWIISPKSFDASYCSGTCSHPLKKNIQSSNHATIQALVQSMGLKKGVPELCCVPHSLNPISLLYWDKNYNIVLKSFPDMSVQNCSCR